MRADNMARVAPGPWITPKPLAESTVAIVSTAGMHRRGDPPFVAGDLSYRIIPGTRVLRLTFLKRRYKGCRDKYPAVVTKMA